MVRPERGLGPPVAVHARTRHKQGPSSLAESRPSSPPTPDSASAGSGAGERRNIFGSGRLCPFALAQDIWSAVCGRRS